MRLIFGTKELTSKFDEITLLELNVQNESNLYVALRLRGGARIEIHVKLFNSEEIKLEIDADMKVSDLKKEI